MNALPTTQSIDAAFRPAFKEISRRSSVARSFEDTEKSYFVRSDSTFSIPYPVPNQKYFLASMGTAVLQPRPVDSSRPALRIFGGFPTREDAIEHADIVAAIDPGSSRVILEQGVWKLLPQTERERDDGEACKKRCQEKLQAYRLRQEEEGDAFDRSVRDKLERPRPPSTNDVPEDKDEQEEAENIVYKPPKRIRAGTEVRGQCAVALCAIPDEFGECIVKILGCFENTLEADKWVENVGSRKITDDDIFVAPTCEWLYPNGNRDNLSARYRVDELQRIMDAAARNPEVVQSYKEWKKSQDEKTALQEESAKLIQSIFRGRCIGAKEKSFGTC